MLSTSRSLRAALLETNVPLATEFLGKGLEAWLTALKATAEASNCE